MEPLFIHQWICITDRLPGFTNGDIYKEPNFFNDLSDIVKDTELLQLYDNDNHLVIASLYFEEEIVNYRFTQKRYGPSKIKKPNFMRLNDWRESQINKILEII